MPFSMRFQTARRSSIVCLGWDCAALNSGWARPSATSSAPAMYEIAQYCDQRVSDGMGGMEPRFTCSLYLQTRESAHKALQDMASMFRGISF